MFARVLFFLLTIAIVQAQQDALRCQDHPAYKSSINPVLIRSFRQHERGALFDRIVYHVNFNSVTYRPRNQPSSTKYDNLDLFYSTGLGVKRGRLATLYFQRPVKVFLFIGVARTASRRVSLAGWKSEGYVEIKSHPSFTEWQFGVFQKGGVKFPRFAHVFSRSAKTQITLPSKDVVHRAIRPLKRLQYFHFRVAEANGRPYAGNKGFLGKPVSPNRPCPETLHRAWRVRHPDNRDSDVKGQTFSSWHPAWDPCFWCSYGHEHGSSPKHIMGYEPTFTYAAFKNSREKEADAGFKSYVIKYGQYWLYVNFHVQVGQLRRVSERWHTIAITVKKISTGEKMLELTHKADFGFLSARGKRRQEFIPLTKKDELLKKEMMKDHRPKLRSVNVINPAKPDKRFSYRSDMFQGVYEAWQTHPMCSSVGFNGGIEVDIRTSASGIKTVARKEYVALRLRGSQRRQVGLSRVIRFRAVDIGTEFCPFRTSGGTFYTNAEGTKLMSGPGRDRIRQFIKPGFKIRIDGRFEALNNGLGVFGVDKTKLNGQFFDHGFGMNPNLN